MNQRFYVLINCNGLGYEVQTLKKVYMYQINDSDEKLTLWIKHVKKEDSDSFYGFQTQDEKSFFCDLLSVKGIGPQIGMSLLNKFTLEELFNALSGNNKSLISSVPGIGIKMTERIFLELKSKLKIKLKSIDNIKNDKLTINDNEKIYFADIKLTLESLNYTKKEIQRALDILYKNTNEINISNLKLERNITFEDMLKKAIRIIDKNSSNLVQ